MFARANYQLFFTGKFKETGDIDDGFDTIHSATCWRLIEMFGR